MESIEYKCIICNKKYKTYQTLWKHNKKFHLTTVIDSNINVIENSKNVIENNNYSCKYCNKEFKLRQYRWSHEKNVCQPKHNKAQQEKEENYKKRLELEIIKENNIRLKEEARILNLKLKLQKSEKVDNIDNEIDNNIIVNHEQPINNQLINIIVDKNKTIEELTTKISYNINNEPLINNKVLGKPLIEFHKLTLNDVIIVSRTEDNYINATQLCQAGNKKFNDWSRLQTTKELIKVLENDIKNEKINKDLNTGIPVLDFVTCSNEAQSETVIPVSQLVDIKIGGDHSGTWVHPDLAIQLAQWISPKFALQVSKWIRTLLTDGQVELLKNKDNELKNKDDELKLKNQKIQLLEDTYIKQQKRKNYPTKNVIYMLTTEDHKKNRLYIIGKAFNLKNRLGNYNKTAEHEVVYYKNCESEKDMSAIETLVLKKLNKYREKANRDRFILPLENDISLFTNVINDCINFLIE